MGEYKEELRKWYGFEGFNQPIQVVDKLREEIEEALREYYKDVTDKQQDTVSFKYGLSTSTEEDAYTRWLRQSMEQAHKQIFELQKLVQECQTELKAKDKEIENQKETIEAFKRTNEAITSAYMKLRDGI